MTYGDGERPGGRYSRISGGATTLWFLALGLALVITLAYGLGQRAANAAQAVALGMERQRAFEQLRARTEIIETLLAKGLITSGGGSAALVYTDLWHQGLAAQENLTALPISDTAIANTARFMTQVADYGRLLVRRTAQGQAITDQDYATLLSMHQTAGDLALRLHELGLTMAQTGFRWETMPVGGWARRVDQAARPVHDGLAELAEYMHDLPALIYDGPYSDHIQGMAPRGLPAGQVDLEQAKQVALRFAPALPGIDPANYRIHHAGNIGGRLPSYSFTLRPAAAPGGAGAAAAPAPEIRVDVTKQGGKVALMIVQGIQGVDTGLELEPLAGGGAPAPAWPRLSASWPGSARLLAPMGPPGPEAETDMLSLAESTERAGRFLAERGLTGFIPTYQSAEEGVATCQFAATQGQVVLYPDQVKVKVRMSDGQILGFEGMNYLMAHTRRDLPEVRVSQAEARARLSPRVEVLGVRTCLVPTPARGEVLCHEFRVRLLDSTFLVYINAVTGEEEAILKVIDQGEAGQLVM